MGNAKKLIAGYDIILEVYRGTPPTGEGGYIDTSWEPVAFVQGNSTSHGRPVFTLGEMGSSAVFTGMQDGTKSMSLSRIITKEDNILKALYAHLIESSYSIGNSSPTDVSESLTGTIDDAGSKDFIGGSGVTLYSVEAAGDTPSSGDLIGMAQSISVNTSKRIDQIPEMGTNEKYLVVDRGNKSMSISRILTEDMNLLKALYSKSSDSTGINGLMWKDLDNEVFKTPIALKMVIKNNDGTVPTEIGLGGVLISGISEDSKEGAKGVVESVSLTWAKTVSTLTSANVIIDLDDPVFNNEIDVRLSYYGNDNDTDSATRDLKAQVILKGMLISNATIQFTAGSYLSVDSCTLRWTKTEEQDV